LASYWDSFSDTQKVSFIDNLDYQTVRVADVATYLPEQIGAIEGYAAATLTSVSEKQSELGTTEIQTLLNANANMIDRFNEVSTDFTDREIVSFAISQATSNGYLMDNIASADRGQVTGFIDNMALLAEQRDLVSQVAETSEMSSFDDNLVSVVGGMANGVAEIGNLQAQAMVSNIDSLKDGFSEMADSMSDTQIELLATNMVALTAATRSAIRDNFTGSSTSLRRELTQVEGVYQTLLTDGVNAANISAALSSFSSLNIRLTTSFSTMVSAAATATWAF
jgi:hypothetical protein